MSTPTPIPYCYAEKCPRCGERSPCVDHVEVDIGIGTQTGDHEFYCPTHGGFMFVLEAPVDWATSKAKAIFREDASEPSGTGEK